MRFYDTMSDIFIIAIDIRLQRPAVQLTIPICIHWLPARTLSGPPESPYKIIQI